MEKKTRILNKKKVKNLVKKLLDKNNEKGVSALTLGCFYDINCNINRCRSEDYDPQKKIGKCCKYYENKCKPTVESLTKKYLLN